MSTVKYNEQFFWIDESTANPHMNLAFLWYPIHNGQKMKERWLNIDRCNLENSVPV